MTYKDLQKVVAQCGATVEDLANACRTFTGPQGTIEQAAENSRRLLVKPTEEDIRKAGLNPSAIFQDEYKK